MARMPREDRSKALEALSAKIKRQLDALDEDALAEYGEMFEGRYSPKNALLILAQRPDATVVRGYNQWKDEGRHVRKGETGIKIRKVVARGEQKNDAGEITKTGYRSVIWLTVFDIDQTDPVAVTAAVAA